MKPTLVILAAGLARRYGRLKQLEPVGPGGAVLMEYTLFDAWRAGFGRVVFVVQAGVEEMLRAALSATAARHLELCFAHQDIHAVPASFSDLPSDRTRPWGTAHAVLAAERHVPGPFAVVNADDFYGRDAFDAVGPILSRPDPEGPPTFALYAYRLCDTCSASGPVSRAVCTCTPEGWLTDIREVTGIERDAATGEYRGVAGPALAADALVSMNCWGLRPGVFPLLHAGFAEFLQASGDSPTAEYYLPEVIRSALRAGQIRVRVLGPGHGWVGLTHAGDQAAVARRLAELTAAGEYPSPLWSRT